jgi:chitinase
MVILAFVISQNYSGPYPEVNFGAACGGATALMESNAPGLLFCPVMAADLTTCQEDYGKKVLLSLGGEIGNIEFETAYEASYFASILWQLFGPPGFVDTDLRPFGIASVDGFDIGTTLKNKRGRLLT